MSHTYSLLREDSSIEPSSLPPPFLSKVKRKVKETSQVPEDLPKKRRKAKFLPINDPEYYYAHGEVINYASYFLSTSLVEDLVSCFNICTKEIDEYVEVECCSTRVFQNHLPDYADFIFAYDIYV